ncbi:ABC transporter ATP-binding protein [Chitinophaga japonensis]|uniref:Osmoprotectant transport system ATP-binding protein n=1 Tax=Chitinophaga japonensis TaxID=104662 RepID=A0A562SZ24_CHIJA|nr:ATP-binding cassette domain-containing protein [Chitinophaga japonensis]TWI86522.1 osmoprotectant transport system ATP-binding protein [Chitinophaga japonensis]
MIKLEHVYKSFNKQHQPAVADVSFEVHPGETLVLLGTSGSGKTTTLRMINRLLTPDSGQIYVNGQAVAEQQPETLRRGIGYVLQDNGLFPHYTVAENIGVVPALLQWDKARIADRTTVLMEKLHLPPGQYRDAYPAQLSGGQQQRVGLARALAADPPVLLMDEPFGALDPVTRASVRREFQALDELQNKTVVMVTHDVQEAFELGTRIGLMDNGRLQQLGTPQELLFAPANDFVRAFFREHHLLLELKALTLADIRPYLPPTAEDDNYQAHVLPGTTSCWDALQQSMNTEGVLSVDFSTTVFTMDSKSLMTALVSRKNEVGHKK